MICFYCNNEGICCIISDDLSISLCHECVIYKMCLGCMNPIIRPYLFCEDCRTKLIRACCLCNKCYYTCLHHCNIPIKNKYMNINIL